VTQWLLGFLLLVPIFLFGFKKGPSLLNGSFYPTFIVSSLEFFCPPDHSFSFSPSHLLRLTLYEEWEALICFFLGFHFYFLLEHYGSRFLFDDEIAQRDRFRPPFLTFVFSLRVRRKILFSGHARRHLHPLGILPPFWSSLSLVRVCSSAPHGFLPIGLVQPRSAFFLALLSRPRVEVKPRFIRVPDAMYALRSESSDVPLQADVWTQRGGNNFLFSFRSFSKLQPFAQTFLLFAAGSLSFRRPGFCDGRRAFPRAATRDYIFPLLLFLLFFSLACSPRDPHARGCSASKALSSLCAGSFLPAVNPYG